jgi:hemerythrin-like domain-containing protein
LRNDTDSSRRGFLVRTAQFSGGAALATTLAFADEKKGEKKKGGEEEDVGPTEDLMREHGVLNRVLLVYDHFIQQLDAKQDVKPEFVTSAASIIHSFVEDYHEKQEEQFLFPRFEKAGVLTDLVLVLKAQHEAGRKLTAQIMTLAKAASKEDRAKLSRPLAQFVRMYRPHEAREDTVLFPEVRKIVSKHEFDALGEQFESNEHKQFGADGFEMYRDKVAALEKQLGIYDLSKFTPQLS